MTAWEETPAAINGDVDTGRLGGAYLSTAKLRERRRGEFDAADTELRRLIREGFESAIPGEQLAEAAGLSLSRVYQISDGDAEPHAASNLAHQ